MCVFLYGILPPSYVGIMINHYKDPYETTSISWKVRRFFVAHLALLLDYPAVLGTLTIARFIGDSSFGFVLRGLVEWKSRKNPE